MKTNGSPLDERRIVQLESAFPTKAGSAFSNAFQQAIGAGSSVLVSEDGKIVEISPDGQLRFVKAIAPPIIVEPGKKYTITR